MKYLIVKIPLGENSGNDMEVVDVEKFVHEASRAAGISLEVGRPLEMGDSPAMRTYGAGAEYFEATLLDCPDVPLADASSREEWLSKQPVAQKIEEHMSKFFPAKSGKTLFLMELFRDYDITPKAKVQ